MSDNKNFSRRNLFKNALWGGVGGIAALDSLGVKNGVQNLPFSNFFDPRNVTLDAYLLMKDAMRGGATFLNWQNAMAAETEPWGLVTIKVGSGVHTPLVFAIGQIVGAEVSTAAIANTMHPATSKAGVAAPYLAAAGAKNLSTSPRLAALRFNEWFGKRLMNGTYDGTPTGPKLGLETFLGAFPDTVAIQVGLNMTRDTSIAVHNLTSMKIRKDQPDLAFFAEKKGLVTSPLGITAFMMGGKYDSNSDEQINKVYNNAEKGVAAPGRTVGSYVANIRQSLSSGYFDPKPLDQNLTYMLDKLVVKDPVRRKALFENRGKLAATIDALSKIETVEKTRHIALVEAECNTQQVGSTKGIASLEFLSQCAYVANSLALPGMPMRNFSLFLNVNDLDGKTFDDPINSSIPDAATMGGLSYVEGMRQLAMGLNILARGIDTNKKNLIVMVVSDSGRDTNMADSQTGFSIVLGPKRPGMLADAIYGPLTALNMSTAASSNGGDAASSLLFNHGGAAFKWDNADSTCGLRDSAGNKKDSTAEWGDIQVGVIDFLDEVTGKKTRLSEQGNFVKLKRG